MAIFPAAFGQWTHRRKSRKAGQSESDCPKESGGGATVGTVTESAAPAIAVDRRNRLILHGMLAGYFERDGTATVDELFFGTELNRQLLAMGKRVRWEQGVSEQLEQEDAERRAVSPRFARVYQLRPEADPLLKFASYEAVSARFGPPVREWYRIVYDGPCCEGDLDDICDRFIDAPPDSFTGHRITISDVLELYGDGGSRFYYIDSLGYRKIKF